MHRRRWQFTLRRLRRFIATIVRWLRPPTATGSAAIGIHPDRATHGVQATGLVVRMPAPTGSDRVTIAAPTITDIGAAKPRKRQPRTGRFAYPMKYEDASGPTRG